MLSKFYIRCKIKVFYKKYINLLQLYLKELKIVFNGVVKLQSINY